MFEEEEKFGYGKHQAYIKVYPSTEATNVELGPNKERPVIPPEELIKWEREFNKPNSKYKPLHFMHEHGRTTSSRIGNVKRLWYNKKDKWLWAAVDGLTKDVKTVFDTGKLDGISLCYQSTAEGLSPLEITATQLQDFPQARVIAAHSAGTSGKELIWPLKYGLAPLCEIFKHSANRDSFSSYNKMSDFDAHDSEMLDVGGSSASSTSNSSETRDVMHDLPHVRKLDNGTYLVLSDDQEVYNEASRRLIAEGKNPSMHLNMHDKDDPHSNKLAENLEEFSKMSPDTQRHMLSRLLSDREAMVEEMEALSASMKMQEEELAKTRRQNRISQTAKYFNACLNVVKKRSSMQNSTDEEVKREATKLASSLVDSEKYDILEDYSNAYMNDMRTVEQEQQWTKRKRGNETVLSNGNNHMVFPEGVMAHSARKRSGGYRRESTKDLFSRLAQEKSGTGDYREEKRSRYSQQTQGRGGPAPSAAPSSSKTSFTFFSQGNGGAGTAGTSSSFHSEICDHDEDPDEDDVIINFDKKAAIMAHSALRKKSEGCKLHDGTYQKPADKEIMQDLLNEMLSNNGRGEARHDFTSNNLFQSIPEAMDLLLHWSCEQTEPQTNKQCGIFGTHALDATNTRHKYSHDVPIYQRGGKYAQMHMNPNWGNIRGLEHFRPKM